MKALESGSDSTAAEMFRELTENCLQVCYVPRYIIITVHTKGAREHLVCKGFLVSTHAMG